MPSRPAVAQVVVVLERETGLAVVSARRAARTSRGPARRPASISSRCCARQRWPALPAMCRAAVGSGMADPRSEASLQEVDQRAALKAAGCSMLARWPTPAQARGTRRRRCARPCAASPRAARCGRARRPGTASARRCRASASRRSKATMAAQRARGRWPRARAPSAPRRAPRASCGAVGDDHAGHQAAAPGRPCPGRRPAAPGAAARNSRLPGAVGLPKAGEVPAEHQRLRRAAGAAGHQLLRHHAAHAVADQRARVRARSAVDQRDAPRRPGRPCRRARSTASRRSPAGRRPPRGSPPRPARGRCPRSRRPRPRGRRRRRAAAAPRASPLAPAQVRQRRVADEPTRSHQPPVAHHRLRRRARPCSRAAAGRSGPACGGRPLRWRRSSRGSCRRRRAARCR